MPFNAILKDLTEDSGAAAAAILDRDGEVVASVSKTPDIEIALIGAHYGVVLDSVVNASMGQRDLRGVKSVLINSGNAGLAVFTIKEGYYLVVVTDEGRPAGKTLFKSGRAVKKIALEIG